MDIITLFFIAVGLAMDAFAVSVASGMIIKNVRVRDGLMYGGYFGAFQFIMPVAGWWLGRAFYEYASAYSHWIAFILLAAIGGKMIWETYRDSESEPVRKTTVWTMVILAVATSIDAMAVGVSFALMDNNIWVSATVIGAISFVISFAGVFLGKQLGNVLKSRAERLGGAILILIGLKILIEGLFF